MSNYQEFAGIKFREEWPGGYYIHNFSGYNIRMHRFVWEYYNGEIPKGYDVHHVDGDKSNNDISNLQLLKSSDHKKLHSDDLTDEEREWRRQNLSNKARPKAIEWHKSEEGSKWHSEHIKQQHMDGVFKRTLKCTQCGKDFIGFYRQGNNFCSSACSAKYRRLKGLDNVTRTCVICGKDFETNKYKKTQCCSSHCSSIFAYRKRRGQ